MTKEIAWIESEPEFTLPYQIEICQNPKVKLLQYKEAKEALNALNAKKFDLIVLNPRLNPGEDYPKVVDFNLDYDYSRIGLDLIVRRGTQNLNVPLILILGYLTKELQKQFLEQGVSEMVNTNTPTKEFYGIVKKYLNQE